ncbi:terminase large subunit domain-containing protein [Streptomyces sp. t39]|uniref:terminase large subunit domain-containing protein n=1 Tax=Streptomyces sp. t39 TaxID=1828156 RepID=UPI00164F32EB|nr:terminase family protein [Streptomyces sp. t39]
MTATADLLEATLLEEYRSLPAATRQRIVAQASPEVRLRLAWVERQMAMDKSPGALAAVLTEGREKQAPHLDLIDDVFRRIAAGERMQVMLTMPPRHGKALALDTPIPTPDGWSTMGELEVGDQIFDELGKPCTVTWTSPTWYDRPCFDVVTDSGGHIVADYAHEWKANLDRRHSDRLYNTCDLARPRSKQAMIWTANALELPDQDLLVPPYLLGAWLGDGRSLDGGITADPEDAKHLRSVIHELGYETVQWANPTVFGVVGLRSQLRQLGVLGNKHVPAPYLRGSISQRRELLQGLVDTDGYVANDGQVEFCSIKQELAEAVQELVYSLGGKASLNVGDATLNGRFISKKYRVMFYMEGAARLPRKAIKCRSGIRANRHYVMAMRRSATATRCIEVDSPSHLFLAGRAMIPTHNSQRASRWGPLWYLRRNPTGRVMIASYGADLADDHGRWVRDQLREHGDTLGIRLDPGSHAANRFDLEAPRGSSVRGGMVTAGVGGSLTGKGFSLGIIDDPFKGSDDANSPAQRQRVWDWYRSVFYTRRAPGASIILINTRWHELDLSGQILANEPENWTLIDLPALALSDTDPLGRTPGKALWPAQYDEEELARTHKAVGERVWWALYQQQPRPLEGGVWQWAWITTTRLSPVAFRGVDLARIVVALDPAGGDSTSHDESGIVAAGRSTDGHYYLLADKTGRHSAEARGRETCLLALDLNADAIVVETNYGGDMARQNVIQAWAELERQGKTGGQPMPRIVDVNAKKGKRLRAEPIAQLYETGQVHHVGEFHELETQMVTWIPGMDSPDRMDAAVHALTELADPASGPVRTGNYSDNRLRGRR